MDKTAFIYFCEATFSKQLKISISGWTEKQRIFRNNFFSSVQCKRLKTKKKKIQLQRLDSEKIKNVLQHF